MPKFIFAYHGGHGPADEEERATLMEKWKAWLGSVGDAAVDPGSPVGQSKTVSSSGVSDGGGPDPLMGFSIIEAENMDGALEIAKGCPHVEIGTIEVAEIKQMQM